MTEKINTQSATLLRRAYLLLEDGEWEKADECAEKVLDGEPENSDAYLCKLLSELCVARKELLSDVQADISQSKNYINALKYADASQKKFLENCAHKARARFLERERIESNQEIIDTFSGLIETYRDTQRFNRNMIKRGKSAVMMYLITYIIGIICIAAFITISSLRVGGDSGFALIMGLGQGLFYPTFIILLWIGHARLVRFWDLDYGDDRGWTVPLFFGIINAPFTLGIWGLIKSIKTLKECKGLKDNIVKMEKQISDLQQQIKEKKALIR